MSTTIWRERQYGMNYRSRFTESERQRIGTTLQAARQHVLEHGPVGLEIVNGREQMTYDAIDLMIDRNLPEWYQGLTNRQVLAGLRLIQSALRGHPITGKRS